MAGYTEDELAKDLEKQDYKFGFVSDIESDKIPKGLNEDVVRLISQKKDEPEWLLEYRLKAFKIWSAMTEPNGLMLHIKNLTFKISLIIQLLQTKIRIMG